MQYRRLGRTGITETARRRPTTTRRRPTTTRRRLITTHNAA